MSGVEGMHGIGETARASGLSVGTLRFYDGAGVLRPAGVDPRTGYRSYTADQVRAARLVAALRAAGMSLAGIRAVLRVRHDRTAVAQACAAHLRALEHDLAVARRVLSTVDALIEPEESPVETTRATVAAAELAAALRTVRHAVSDDPELPALHGVLLDIGEGVTAVATDRYRLATVDVAAEVSGPATAALVPVALVDAVIGLLSGSGEVELLVDGGLIRVTAASGTVAGELATEPFPDYRGLLPAGPGRAASAAEARAAIGAPAAERMAGARGEVREFALLDAGPEAMWIDREFLREALDAAGEAAVLEFAGPVQPLTIRSEQALLLLMPAKPPAQ